MKFTSHIILVLLFSIFSSLAFSKGTVNKFAQDVSIIKLLAVPEKYDSKPVRIIGASSFQFEESVICLSMEDIKHTLYDNCLTVHIAPDLVHGQELSDMYSDKYVLIEGIFKMGPVSTVPKIRKNPDGSISETTYHGLTIGEIVKVNRIDLWNVPR